jgi:hypothetical protein
MASSFTRKASQVKHHVIAAIEQFIQRRWGEEALDRIQLDRRIDRPQAFSHDRDLGLAKLTIQRMHLAIGVGYTHFVGVYQCEVAHTATRQRFGGPRTHATDADHTDMALRQLVHTTHAVQALHAGEALTRKRNLARGRIVMRALNGRDRRRSF